MTVWLASREYAGIAEAGGVKNVACSLSEALVKEGCKVVLFIPLYGCSDLSNVEDFCCMWHKPVVISIANRRIIMTFSHGKMNGVEIVFIGHKSFSEKQAVYTYTHHEELLDPTHEQGTGHLDSHFMDTLFQKSVVAYANTCSFDEAPDIIHSQDASAAMIPAFVEYKSDLDKGHQNFFQNTKCVVTIHNAGPGYHHEFADVKQALYYTSLPEEKVLKALNGKSVEPFLLGMSNSILTTVSPQYANEIERGITQTAGLSELFKANNIHVTGITNGIDFERYDPSDKSSSGLPFTYNPEKQDLEGKYLCRKNLLEEYCLKEQSAEPINEIRRYGYLTPEPEGNYKKSKTVYFAYHGRVVEQKGIRCMAPAADVILSNPNLDAKFIFIGQGQAELENLLAEVAQKHPGKCVYFKGYDRNLSRLCLASADFTLIPSEFEPCCLEDFISQIVGSIPVAHNTGGLGKIIDGETGFLYDNNTVEELSSKMTDLTRIFNNGGSTIFDALRTFASSYVHHNYSWKSVVANRYLPLYNSLLK